jgi:predicted DNA-binding transcriptional regulator YafY
MRRAERLFRLVNELRTRSVTRAEDLAKHFEVSVRTVYRDLAHLQASGMPIEGEAGVGYLLRPGFDLPITTFTHEQVDALAIGLAFVESLDDPALAIAAREVRAKLQAGLPQPETRKLADAPYFAFPRTTGGPAHAGLIRTAMREQRIVELLYCDAAERPSLRRVRPVAVWHLVSGWMFTAWCELRQDFRTFRFDRIARMDIAPETFEADPAKSLQAFFEKERCDSAINRSFAPPPARRNG